MAQQHTPLAKGILWKPASKCENTSQEYIGEWKAPLILPMPFFLFSITHSLSATFLVGPPHLTLSHEISPSICPEYLTFSLLALSFHFNGNLHGLFPRRYQHLEKIKKKEPKKWGLISFAPLNHIHLSHPHPPLLGQVTMSTRPR